MTENKQAFLKALSAVASNLSAAWFALAIVTPNFTAISTSEVIIALIRDIIFGIIWLVITALIERIIS